ncbi:asparaginase domain-containing protein [Wenzhouxiangella sp. EGI_FJ10409]|uniref:asparaginase domain-containing protein n=1 Tax=Wenzhouxiangella sp. EGI_FJ10409 TaxID=3243767 RepID=UPI0035D61E2C
MNKLNILTTGGTIDKIYYDDKSDYQIGEPEIGRILKAMNVAFDWEIRALMRKDSLNMSEADRDLICQAVMTSTDGYFLITHGTDTMVDTAAALGDVGERVIVLTGALNPARFIDSDAVFNIGCAVGAVQALPAGVWIAMNGRIWDPKTVRKNRSENRFEAVG